MLMSMRVRAYLLGLPPTAVPITYGQLARALGLTTAGSIAKVTQALEMTMAEDAEAGAPFLAALVVGKIGNGSASGFHLQARSLGRQPGEGEDETAYHQREFIGARALLTAQDCP